MTWQVFEVDRQTRGSTLLRRLTELTEHHRARCTGYRRILAATGHGRGRAYSDLSELPWLPVRLFKQHTLHSIKPDEVYRVLTSSGTTGSPSKIYLDRAATGAQRRALAATMHAVLGPARLPMLIVDSPAVLWHGSSMSGRAAGIVGMMVFGRDHAFVLDGSERPDRSAVRSFLCRHANRPFLVFGYTHIVWRYLGELAGEGWLDLSNGVLVHSGGWKRLADEGVDSGEFRQRFERDTGLRRFHNFYGMVEQMGTVFPEGPSGGSLYCPEFAEVIVRDPVTWQPCPVGQSGVIQVLSTLPRSYPGHILLTDDVGVVHGVDDGDWPGTRFSVLGRLPTAEPRGCGDTYVDRAA